MKNCLFYCCSAFVRVSGSTTIATLLFAMVAAVLATGCASSPPPPEWQVDAKGAIDRSVAAYLDGNRRVDAAELARARGQLSRTGRVDLLADAELLHCAAQVASLEFGPCTAFTTLAADAEPPQRAYADYLAGTADARSAALLPVQQRAAANGDAMAAKAIADPLSRLVAAGVLLRTGRASAPLVADAIDTASAQGWRRPLLAWLGVQALRAEQAGDLSEAARLRRRIDIAAGAAPTGSLAKP